jgi:hypothetical protein
MNRWRRSNDPAVRILILLAAIAAAAIFAWRLFGPGPRERYLSGYIEAKACSLPRPSPAPSARSRRKKDSGSRQVPSCSLSTRRRYPPRASRPWRRLRKPDPDRLRPGQCPAGRGRGGRRLAPMQTRRDAISTGYCRSAATTRRRSPARISTQRRLHCVSHRHGFGPRRNRAGRRAQVAAARPGEPGQGRIARGRHPRRPAVAPAPSPARVEEVFTAPASGSRPTSRWSACCLTIVSRSASSCPSRRSRVIGRDKTCAFPATAAQPACPQGQLCQPAARIRRRSSSVATAATGWYSWSKRFPRVLPA